MCSVPRLPRSINSRRACACRTSRSCSSIASSDRGRAEVADAGRVVTEHDVRAGRWYLDSGRIPTCIAVEAGQADLFLSGLSRHRFPNARARRLSPARCRGHVPPRAARPGRHALRHPHRRFFRQGDTYLFRFRFEGTVNGEPSDTMRDGGRRLLHRRGAGRRQGRRADRARIGGPRPASSRTTGAILPPMAVESYDDGAGRGPAPRRSGADASAPRFAGSTTGAAAPARRRRLRLVDRVPRSTRAAAASASGLIRAEADIHPDDWFLTCHFVDDQVMPGTLMYECCLHTLRIFLHADGLDRRGRRSRVSSRCRASTVG